MTGMITPKAPEVSASQDEMELPTESAYYLKTVDNALRVLETFDQQHREMGVTEISERVGLHKSIVFRILHTLMARGYVEQMEASHKFRLGLKAFEVGSRAVNQLGLGALIQPVVERLAAECNETVNVGRLSGRDIVYVNKVVPQRILRLDVQVGARFPAHCTALGKAILAYLPDTELEAYLEDNSMPRFTNASIGEIDILKKELDGIRRLGHAWSHEELFEGITCVAAPIWAADRKVFAAVSIAMPSQRAQLPERREELTDMIISTANEISAIIDKHI